MSRPDPTPFDTHRFVKRLTEAVMPTCQAEVLAEEQVTLLDTHLATKRDVATLQKDMAVLRAELLMVKWLVSGVGFGMIALLLKTFWVA